MPLQLPWSRRILQVRTPPLIDVEHIDGVRPPVLRPSPQHKRDTAKPLAPPEPAERLGDNVRAGRVAIFDRRNSVADADAKVLYPPLHTAHNWRPDAHQSLVPPPPPQLCIPLDGTNDSGDLLVEASRPLTAEGKANLEASWVVTALQLDVPFTDGPVDLMASATASA